MRQVQRLPAHILILFFLLIWGTDLVCVFFGHHTTERNYAHAHFSISMTTGDYPFAAHNSATPGGNSTSSHDLSSPGLVTFISGHTGATDTVTGQPLIVPESTLPSPTLWEFPVAQSIWSPLEVFQPPPDRPPTFPA